MSRQRRRSSGRRGPAARAAPRLALPLGTKQRRVLREAGRGYLKRAHEAVNGGLDACAGFADDRQHYAQVTQRCLDGLQQQLEAALCEPEGADLERQQWGGHGRTG